MGAGYLTTGPGGASFLDSRDVPDAFVANALLKSNAGASALEFSSITEDGSALNMGTRDLLGTDGAWDIGQNGANRPGNVFASVSILSTTLLADNGNFSMKRADFNSGIEVGGLATGFSQSRDNPFVFINAATGRDVANGIVAATIFNRNAAAITFASTVRLHSFGFTNNVSTYSEKSAMYADGIVEGESLRAKGDIAGVAGTTTLTNATAVADTNVPTHINTPTGVAAGQAVWIRMKVGTTVTYIAGWQ